MSIRIRSTLPILFVLGLMNCQSDQPGEVWETRYVHMVVPEEAAVNQDIEITVSVLSGCTTNLQINWKEMESRHFLITARALVVDTPCPLVIIPKDSVFILRPIMPGKYFFQANESPLEIIRDTLIVN